MKLIIQHTILILLLLSSLVSFSQRNADLLTKHRKQVAVASNKSEDSKNLTANFITLDRLGSAPMTVQFKDASEGQPTGWNWNFGDGNSDTVKNPLHVYQEPGNYTVKLSITKGSESSSLTRNNYIVVVSGSSCDTLYYPLAGDYTLYVISQNGSGYVSGNNSYGDLAKASYFQNNSESEIKLIGGIFDFAVAKRSMASDKQITFKAWDCNGEGGSPGKTLAENTLFLSHIVQEVGFGWSTLLFFNDPPEMNQPFFLGVELSKNYGDTLALYTNLDGDVIDGNGWEQHDNGNWYPYSNQQFSWNINIDHAIFPLMHYSTGISNHILNTQLLVYPIPASDMLNIRFLDPADTNALISLTNLTGKTELQIVNTENSNISLPVDQLKPGIYLLRIETKSSISNQKIIIAR